MHHLHPYWVKAACQGVDAWLFQLRLPCWRPEAQVGSPCAGRTHCSCSGPGGSGRALAACYGCHCGCQASPRRQHSLQRLIPHHGAFV